MSACFDTVNIIMKSRMRESRTYGSVRAYIVRCESTRLLRRIWMKLFLCSHFSSVGSLIKEEIDNKKVAFYSHSFAA